MLYRKREALLQPVVNSLIYTEKLLLVSIPLAVLKLVRTGRKSFRLGTRLQQCLPLAVLKQSYVATVNLPSAVATVLTACGIETFEMNVCYTVHFKAVATVLTACGIETSCHGAKYGHTLSKMLQQCLPLAVLKLDNRAEFVVVLLHSCNSAYRVRY